MSNQFPLSPDPLPSPVYSTPAVPPRPSTGLAIAGLIFAIVSLLAAPFFFLIGAFFIGLFVGIASSIVGMILSALGLRSPSRRALAIVGLSLSIVVFVLLVLLILYLTPVRVERH